MLFHLWLFGSQLLDGRLTELGPILRWLMAPAWWPRWPACAAGAPRGQRPHGGGDLAAGGPAPRPRDRGRQARTTIPGLAEVVTTLAQIAAASVALGLGLALLAGLLRRLAAPRLVIARAVGRRRTRPVPTRSLAPLRLTPPSAARLARFPERS